MAFSSDYLEVRRLEGRLLSPEQVEGLSRGRLPPDVPSEQLHEWPLRWHSVQVILRRMATLHVARVLDAGCGCGWTSAMLEHEGYSAVAVDPVIRELAVGRQLGLSCSAARIEQLPFAPGRFEAVLAASSVQYLPDLADAISRLRAVVSAGGSVFVCDTPFYDDSEVDSAQRRSRSHYRGLGVPEAAEHYHHHTWSSLQALAPRVLYDPRKLRHRVARRLRATRSPFPVLEFPV